MIAKYGLVKSKDKITELVQKTNIKKYGCTSPLKSEEFKNKMKQTNLEKYGVEWGLQNNDIKEKRKQTNIKKYGVENPFANKDIQEKIKQTNINKYGTEYAMQNKDISEKSQKNMHQTVLDKYNVDNIMMLDEYKNKVKQTNLEKYGGHPMTNKECQEKYKATCLEKYGVEHVMQDPEIAARSNEKHKKTMIEKYGFANIGSIGKDPELTNLISDDIAFSDYIKNNGQGKTINELSNFFGYSYSRIQQRILELDLKEYIIFKPQYSTYETEIVNYLRSLGINNIITNDRIILNGVEIDIYLPDYKLGIEFNGNYWHSNAIKEKSYHQKKSLLAENNGIRLIHIYEYEWTDERTKNIIKSILKISTGKAENHIYARNCIVKEIPNNEAKSFNDKNHIQKHRDAKITYGLFYNDELVQLMSFSKHSKYEWEIIRGCPGSNNVVVGGISKLFNHFIKEHNPNSVFSYCDFNKFDGIGYERLGMKYIGLTSPDKTYIINNIGVKRNPSRAKEYDKIAQGVIWGSGSKKYLWTKTVE